MKKTTLLERFPYRFVETQERGWIEKYNLYTKRYVHMYEVCDERQMAVLLEDGEYVKWLDPDGVPCYNNSRGVYSHPYAQFGCLSSNLNINEPILMMEQKKTFNVRFDERTKQILVSLLENGIQQTSQAIIAGDYNEELLSQHEELTQVKNGILYTRPDEPKEPRKEETPEEMYKSQDRPQ